MSKDAFLDYLKTIIIPAVKSGKNEHLALELLHTLASLSELENEKTA